MIHKPCPSDVSDGEWELVAPDLTLLSEAAPQREHPLREVCNGLRYTLKTGAALALDAERPAAVGCGIPADAALA